MQDKLGYGFLKTKKNISERIKEVFTGGVDEALYEELTECLVLADVPVACAEKIIDCAKEKLIRKKLSDIEALKEAVRESITDMLSSKQKAVCIETPAIVLFTGVNGVGKTTTIAKVANILNNEGKRVLLAAADTFRAAASEQLAVWAKRLNVPVVKSAQGQDPAGIIYDALDSAKAKSCDVVLCDTAGRLQNKANLMNELAKIYKVCAKFSDSFNVYTLIVLDAALGQNSLSQLEGFLSVVKADGIVLTKTDGSAKGGVVIGMADKYDVPVWYVGTGEGLEDIAPFDAARYAQAVI